MIKLNYKTMVVDNYTILYAKYRKNRNIRMTIDAYGAIKITCPYLTSDHEIKEFVLERLDWIKKTIEKLDKKTNLSSLKPLNKNDKKILLRKIEFYIKKYENLMCTYVSKFSIRKMKTLWGSCTYKDHSIRFNSMLYYMSDEFIEYIVVHEMSHIFVHNHSKAFYDHVKKYLPNYKKIWSEHKKVSLA